MEGIESLDCRTVTFLAVVCSHSLILSIYETSLYGQGYGNRTAEDLLVLKVAKIFPSPT